MFFVKKIINTSGFKLQDYFFASNHSIKILAKVADFGYSHFIIL